MYDYEELSRLLPELKEHIKNGRLDYSNSSAVRLLNTALLLKEFNLKVKLPEGHLCPTVPNRAGYIKQIEFLLYEIFKLQKESKITGIDIGTGTSCIYPLIGCVRNENWNFIATDIDDEIIEHARSNVNMNPKIRDRIQIVKNPDPSQIFPETLELNLTTPKFVMCNPPFYIDSDDLEARRAFKRHKTISGQWEMSKEELGTELGGEIGFIKKLIKESAELSGKNILLFSCMLGMKESLNQLIEHLSNSNTVKSFAFELLQVKHTCRYLLFWSFTLELPKDSNHRLRITAKVKRMQIIEVDDEFYIENYIKDLDSTYGDGTSVDSDCITITHNKWSRKYRRSPSTAPALPQPIKITIQKSGNNLIFIPDEEADWETFLSFINHLRK